MIECYCRLRDQHGPVLAMLTIALLYLLMIDLKGIWTDEGFRFGITNGGRLFLAPNSGFTASFAEVLSALNTANHQPLYFLLMNFLSKITHSHNIILFRLINHSIFIEIAIHDSQYYPGLAGNKQDIRDHDIRDE